VTQFFLENETALGGLGGGGNTGGKHFTVWVPRSVWCLNYLGGCYI